MMAPDALPLHLMLSMMQSASFPSAWPSWNASWPDYSAFNPFLPKPKSPFEQSSEAMLKAWQNMGEQWGDAGKAWQSAASPPVKNKSAAPAPKSFADFTPYFFQPDFLSALGEQAFRRSANFLEGVQAYLSSEYQRETPDYPVLWEGGTAKLYDLAPEHRDGIAVLLIPSLINRSYVLDLYPGASFAQFLKKQGFRPLLLDWGDPGEMEKTFTTADYITSHALDALREARAQHDGPLALLGYCMGGIFALAVAQLASMFVDALVLFATPWDFSAPDTPRLLLEPTASAMLRQWIRSLDPVPPVVTQTLFHLIDPWRVQEKYSAFPALDKDARKHFLAVEEWVNDGVPLTRAVAEECFVDWPQGNILANHQWKVGRRWIDPSAVTIPTLAVIPERDLIVPKGVASPLAQELPRCDTLRPDAGHVSMVVGKRAPELLWKPTAEWLNARF